MRLAWFYQPITSLPLKQNYKRHAIPTGDMLLFSASIEKDIEQINDPNTRTVEVNKIIRILNYLGFFKKENPKKKKSATSHQVYKNSANETFMFSVHGKQADPGTVIQLRKRLSHQK